MILVFSGCTQQKAPIVCNKPYIIKGTECCLDQNSNNICDSEEKPGEFNFVVYADSDYDERSESYSWKNEVPSSEISLFTRKEGISVANELIIVYGGIHLYIDTNPENKAVNCKIKEYYDNRLNTETEKELSWSEWHLDGSIDLYYETDTKPDKVKYLINCKRKSDGASLTKEYIINLVYPDDQFSIVR